MTALEKILHQTTYFLIIIVSLKDKLNYLNHRDYNVIHLRKPILYKNKYAELEKEFQIIFAE